MKAIQCPHCGAASVHWRGKRNALYPVGILVVIGLPFAMLHQVSSPQEYRCEDCAHSFQRRSTLSKIALVLLILFGVVFGLLAFVTFVVSFLRW